MRHYTSYYRNERDGHVSEWGATSKGRTMDDFVIEVVLCGDEPYTNTTGVRRLRQLVSKCLSGRWDWRKEDTVEGNFYAPYIRLCRQMMGVRSSPSISQRDCWVAITPPETDQTRLLTLRLNSEKRHFTIGLLPTDRSPFKCTLKIESKVFSRIAR